MSVVNLTEDIQLPLIYKKNSTLKRHHQRSTDSSDNWRRIVSKRGRPNIRLDRIPEKSLRYLGDLWSTLVNTRWRWLMLTVFCVNLCAYFLFGVLFMLDAWVSGDFELPPKTPRCIEGTRDFTGFFLLGVETITSTGYGYHYPTERCRLSWLILTFSTLTMILIDGAFISVVYAKIGRPARSGVLFGRRAVICTRNGRLSLVFRVNDRAGKHWIDTIVSVHLIADGHLTELELTPVGMLFWPVDVVHKINENSPLWSISAKALMTKRFELLVSVTGSSVLTGRSSISQTSYLHREILWGHRFDPCLNYDCARGEYVIDLKNFDRTVPHDTPLCSAKHLNDIEMEIDGKSL